MARRKPPRRTGLKALIISIAVMVALFVIGDESPQLRDIVVQIGDALLEGEGPPPGPRATGTARVIDGDTLDLDDRRVRLHGVDAPEARQQCRRNGRDWPCGEEATRSLRAVIGTHPLTCEERDIDRYGRSVATCTAGAEDVNAWMVRNGWALAYRQYGGDAYDAEEAAAQKAGRGVWAGDFTMPWDWRRQNR